MLDLNFVRDNLDLVKAKMLGSAGCPTCCRNLNRLIVNAARR